MAPSNRQQMYKRFDITKFCDSIACKEPLCKNKVLSYFPPALLEYVLEMERHHVQHAHQNVNTHQNLQSTNQVVPQNSGEDTHAQRTNEVTIPVDITNSTDLDSDVCNEKEMLQVSECLDFIRATIPTEFDDSSIQIIKFDMEGELEDYNGFQYGNKEHFYNTEYTFCLSVESNKWDFDINLNIKLHTSFSGGRVYFEPEGELVWSGTLFDYELGVGLTKSFIRTVFNKYCPPTVLNFLDNKTSLKNTTK